MSLPGSVAEGLIARVAGPMGLRFVFQPLVGLLLGARDGMIDAKAGEPPFIFDLIVNRENRKAKLANIIKSLSKTIIIAIVLDVIVQYLMQEAPWVPQNNGSFVRPSEASQALLQGLPGR